VEKITHSTAHLTEQLYIHSHFDNGTVSITENMLQQLRKQFHEEIDTLGWIDPPVRSIAHQKLDAMVFNVGYPKHWEPFNVKVQKGRWYENAFALEREEVARSLRRLTRPVDRYSWGDSSALEINAFYDIHKNAIFVPAGILQRPFVDASASASDNFGSLGTLLGHEMTHAFDDQGRHFSPDGKMHDWWDARTARAYSSRARCIAKYYSSFSVDGMHANGPLELGENIADNGGIRLAWKALQHTTMKRLDARTFFMSYARQWCEVGNAKTTRTEMLTDPHAPGPVRVNAPLALMAQFSSTFHCSSASFMNRTSDLQCRLWR
jgi:predicted metalloendopeptidase